MRGLTIYQERKHICVFVTISHTLADGIEITSGTNQRPRLCQRHHLRPRGVLHLGVFGGGGEGGNHFNSYGDLAPNMGLCGFLPRMFDVYFWNKTRGYKRSCPLRRCPQHRYLQRLCLSIQRIVEQDTRSQAFMPLAKIPKTLVFAACRKTPRVFRVFRHPTPKSNHTRKANS